MKKKTLASHGITRDSDIRAVLMPMLLEKYLHSDGDLALQEFICNSARVDVAVMNGVMHGFEIKSDSDSLYRLPDQMASYEGVFDLITVVVGRCLLEAVEDQVPPHCGIILARYVDGRIRLTHKRKAKKNPNQRGYDLARLLWKCEALQLLRGEERRIVNSRSSANRVWDAVAQSFEIDALSQAVRRAIKIRRSNESALQSESNDGSSTIGSTALLDHYSENLAQLLAAESQHHLG